MARRMPLNSATCPPIYKPKSLPAKDLKRFQQHGILGINYDIKYTYPDGETEYASTSSLPYEYPDEDEVDQLAEDMGYPKGWDDVEIMPSDISDWSEYGPDLFCCTDKQRTRQWALDYAWRRFYKDALRSHKGWDGNSFYTGDEQILAFNGAAEDLSHATTEDMADTIVDALLRLGPSAIDDIGFYPSTEGEGHGYNVAEGFSEFLVPNPGNNAHKWFPDGWWKAAAVASANSVACIITYIAYQIREGEEEFDEDVDNALGNLLTPSKDAKLLRQMQASEDAGDPHNPEAWFQPRNVHDYAKAVARNVHDLIKDGPQGKKTAAELHYLTMVQGFIEEYFYEMFVDVYPSNKGPLTDPFKVSGLDEYILVSDEEDSRDGETYYAWKFEQPVP